MQKRPTSKSKLHSAANQGGPGKQSDMLRCPRAYPRIHQLNNNLMTFSAVLTSLGDFGL